MHPMKTRKTNRLRRPLLALFPAVLIAILCGCQERGPSLVPVSEAQPLMTYQNSSPRFSLKVFMYAPGNLLFRAESLLTGFRLVQIPDITSPTGRILQAHVIDENTFEFNLILPGSSYIDSPNDLIIPWILEEKGEDAFLRSEGNIYVDISTSPGAKYFVKSVTYQSGTDVPTAKGELL